MTLNSQKHVLESLKSLVTGIASCFLPQALPPVFDRFFKNVNLVSEHSKQSKI